jgi:hypothetical protein
VCVCVCVCVCMYVCMFVHAYICRPPREPELAVPVVMVGNQDGTALLEMLGIKESGASDQQPWALTARLLPPSRLATATASSNGGALQGAGSAVAEELGAVGFTLVRNAQSLAAESERLEREASKLELPKLPPMLREVNHMRAGHRLAAAHCCLACVSYLVW